MPIKLHHHFFSVSGCEKNKNDLFVFGDNLDRHGKGGQATIRDCANAVGLASKIHPTRNADAYFTDEHTAEFDEEMKRFHGLVAPHLRAGGTVWWPADGIGTGLSEMPKRAPGLYQKLCSYSRGLFAIKGEETYVTAIICGGRTYDNRPFGYEKLDSLLGKLAGNDVILEVIEGGAKGADTLGGEWADARGFIRNRIPADWKTHGRAAGFIRNDDMANRLQARRDQAGVRSMVIGMPGGTGTKMMLKISRERGFEVSSFEDPSYVPPEAPRRRGASKPRIDNRPIANEPKTDSQPELDL
jgi:hypothetical protein